MSNIQEARSVLKKWRANVKQGVWRKLEDVEWPADDGEMVKQAAIGTDSGPLTWDDHGGDVFTPEDARLIVGMAGNPELLDAIDAMLRMASAYPGLQWVDGDAYRFLSAADRIAAAIIAADERMSA